MYNSILQLFGRYPSPQLLKTLIKMQHFGDRNLVSYHQVKNISLLGPSNSTSPSLNPEIETSSTDWAQQSRCFLLDDGDRFQSPKCHNQKIGVWCATTATQIVGSIFLKRLLFDSRRETF
jgi:hypothetical protein